MESNINFYTTLSSIYWKPISFSTFGNQTKLKSVPVLTNNGMFFNMIEFLRDCTDYSSNHNVGMFLTNLKTAQDFLEDGQPPEENQPFEIIRSPLGTFNPTGSSTVVKLTSNGLYFNMITSTSAKFSESDVLNLMFIQKVMLW